MLDPKKILDMVERNVAVVLTCGVIFIPAGIGVAHLVTPSPVAAKPADPPTGPTLAQAEAPTPAQCEPVQCEPVRCERKQFVARIYEVTDGDSLKVMLDLGMETHRDTVVRIIGIDTPEVHGPKKNRDMVRGPLATEFTRAWVAAQPGGLVHFIDHGWDKWRGRRDGELFPIDGGPRLSTALELAGHAK